MVNAEDYFYLGNIKRLNAWTKEYDEGHPTVSDKEWDDVYFEIVKYEREHPDCIQPVFRLCQFQHEQRGPYQRHAFRLPSGHASLQAGGVLVNRHSFRSSRLPKQNIGSILSQSRSITYKTGGRYEVIY